MILVTRKRRKNLRARHELLGVFWMSMIKRLSLKQNYATLQDCLIFFEDDMYHVIRKKPVNKKQVRNFKKWFWRKMLFEAFKNGNMIEFYYSGILFKTLPERVRFTNKVYNKNFKKRAKKAFNRRKKAI